jgi:pantothenate kinase
VSSRSVVELTTAELVTRARALAGPRSLLGISGPPGAGKSTLAETLTAAMGDEAALVGMDGFHLAQHELVRLGRAQRKGAPDTFDSFGYAALLQRLRTAAEPVVYAPLFRRDLEEPIANAVPVSSEVSLVVTEGNYLLLDADGWGEARRQLDEVWFLDLPDDIRLDRLIRRHQAFGKDADAARAWALGTDQRNAELVERGRAGADLVVRWRTADA